MFIKLNGVLEMEKPQFNVGDEIVYLETTINTEFHGVIGVITGVYSDFVSVKSELHRWVSLDNIRLATPLDKLL